LFGPVYRGKGSQGWRIHRTAGGKGSRPCPHGSYRACLRAEAHSGGHPRMGFWEAGLVTNLPGEHGVTASLDVCLCDSCHCGYGIEVTGKARLEKMNGARPITSDSSQKARTPPARARRRLLVRGGGCEGCVRLSFSVDNPRRRASPCGSPTGPPGLTTFLGEGDREKCRGRALECVRTRLGGICVVRGGGRGQALQ
jgi:hypothetical protein